MLFKENILTKVAPGALAALEALWPRRESYSPSPADWRDEVLYFLLPDRFSDGREVERPLLDRQNLAAARPPNPDGTIWRWDKWAESGAGRWQGGTLRGVISKLDYLQHLGVTTLWVGPVFQQRGHLNTYHGYGVQDFLEVDSRLGTRADLVELVRAAHERGLCVILDIIFNHSGANWLYPPGTPGGIYEPHYTTGQYPANVAWRDAHGQPLAAGINGRAEGVWPRELQDAENYTRAGRGDLGAGDINDPQAEHKRSDFFDLRDFQLGRPEVLKRLVECYKYWIGLTDCDGFRLDTLKHVSLEEARNFCGAIKEFAARLGKHNFLLVGEIAGGDFNEARYLDVLERNLNAALDIGEMRNKLRALAQGKIHPSAYFDGFDARALMGSHRNVGLRHISVLDDHDHVSGEKLRFATHSANPQQIVAAVAIQLYTLGIPCLYYGTEQTLAGPEPTIWEWLPEWGRSDRYLREAMFGPEHPRRAGLEGVGDTQESFDSELPGFGPFGTVGHHCFSEQHPTYRQIAALLEVRREYAALRYGRQYLRPIAFLQHPFGVYGEGELLAWSRILDDEEALCVINPNGTELRGADIQVDAALNPVGKTMTVVANVAGQLGAEGNDLEVGAAVSVHRDAAGRAYVSVRDLPSGAVVVLVNHA